MPDGFFQKKRKRVNNSSGNQGTRSRLSSSRAGPSRKKHGAASASDSDQGDGGVGVQDMDLLHRYDEGMSSDAEAQAAETAAEARVRLARTYLDGLSRQHESDPEWGAGADAAAIDKQNIAARLEKDVAEQGGRVHSWVAARLAIPHSVLIARSHRLSVTAALASPEQGTLFTAAKDGDIIKWNLQDGRLERILPRRSRNLHLHLDQNPNPNPNPNSNLKLNRERLNKTKRNSNSSKSSGAARRRRRSDAAHTFLALSEEEGHTDEVWALALSSDGTYLVSGGKDKRIGVWGLKPERWIRALGGHKDSISGLSFRPSSSELYTSSFDRTIKLFDVSQLSYIETLFGHQEAIVGLSTLRAPLALSAGGRDRTCRLWKIRDESQLVFRAGVRSKLRAVLEGGDMLSSHHAQSGAGNETIEASVECVSMVDDTHFLSGGDSGAICLWDTSKKKPVYTCSVAHGMQENGTPRWITSIAALAYGDIFASGSWDGLVRVWRLDSNLRSFEPLFSIPAQGVVNSLQIVSPPPSTAFKTENGLIASNVVNSSAWKRYTTLHSHSQENEKEKEKSDTLIPNLGSKDSVPPILVAALGQEHKFGRWIQLKDARNVALVVPFLFDK